MKLSLISILFLLICISYANAQEQNMPEGTYHCDTFGMPVNNTETKLICRAFREGYAEIELNCYGSMQKKVSINNAAFGDDYFREVAFDTIGFPEFIVNAYNRSSNYGAVHPVLVYMNGGWWDMMSLPFQQFQVIDEDNDGIYEIWEKIPQNRKLRYNNGVFEAIDEENTSN